MRIERGEGFIYPFDGLGEGCSQPIKAPIEKSLSFSNYLLYIGQYLFIALNFCLTGSYRIILILSLELILNSSKEHRLDSPYEKIAQNQLHSVLVGVRQSRLLSCWLSRTVQGVRISSLQRVHLIFGLHWIILDSPLFWVWSTMVG